MQKFKLGGERLGSGNKMEVEVRDYGKSNHNLSQTIRTTAAAGVLIPFGNYVVLNGDTFDIDLDANVLTLPTTGPLFGSMKVQLDLFFCPYRLYQGRLHNNEVGLGLKMNEVYLPQIGIKATTIDLINADKGNTLITINPSSLLAHTGILGAGISDIQATRYFNGTNILAYYDIYKNYYANKQEEYGKVIHTETGLDQQQVNDISIETNGIESPILQLPLTTNDILCNESTRMRIDVGFGEQNLDNILIKVRILATNSYNYNELPLLDFFDLIQFNSGTYWLKKSSRKVNFVVAGWRYATSQELVNTDIGIADFPLENIDKMRSWLLSKGYTAPNTPVIINDFTELPYSMLNSVGDGGQNYKNPMEGLALKTYQSDKFHNWLEHTSIDSINTSTSLDVSTGILTMNSLNFAEKIYNVMNRVAAAGGTYEDWQKAVYGVETVGLPELPIYIGGLSKELVFAEVVANSAAGNSEQQLGTLGGRGVMSNKHKGGSVRFNAKEAGIIMGIFSITPRVGYSQGNEWYTGLKTMDDLHKPELDGIGFQNSMEEERAWWSTYSPNGIDWNQHAIGYVPAWINYMTETDKIRGNFALPGNMDYMVFNRNYEWDNVGAGVARIKDATTYIDPKKFNSAFAVVKRDAQNYWVNIGMNVMARRVMSGVIIPTL